VSINDMLKSNEPQGVELRIDKILAEVRAAIPVGKTVDVGGKTFTIDELVKELQGYQAFFAGPREMRAALRQAVADRERISPDAKRFLSDLKLGFVGVLGRSNPMLERLGFPPRKENRELSVEEKLRKVAKAKLTREERHTLGPRQKEQIRAKGEPTIVVAPDHTTVNPAPTGGVDSRPSANGSTT
jgi:hypothetical protein